jgi:excisionase family DNA binding protein
MPDPEGQLSFEPFLSPEEHRQNGRQARAGDRLGTDELLKPEELRRILNVSRSWLYEAANAGRIPSVRLGPDGPLRFDPEAIKRWLECCGDGVRRAS